MGMFDFDNSDFIGVPSGKYFNMVRGIGELDSENKNLKYLNENQMNTIIDLRNEITDLKKQNGDLCALVGKKSDQLRNQADTIRDLDKKLAELRAGAKDLQEQNQILKDSIKQLQDECSKKEEDIHYWKTKSDDYWNRRSVWKDKYDQLRKAYEIETADLKKKLKSVCETCDVPDNCVNASEAVLKDADAKIQSANDKAANAKKEAKQAKETAERYREENFILNRKIEQITRLNDELIKELARQQNAELIMKFTRKGED